MAPAVTVIVPTYNRAHALLDTLACVEAQTLRDWHAIVVDDGSTDDTPRVLAARFADDPRVEVVRQTNAGVAAARNTGLARARGDYIAFLDSDDRWLPWKLETQVAVLRALERENVGMLWTNLDWIDPRGELAATRVLERSYSSYALLARHGLTIFRARARLGDLAPGLAAPPPDTEVRWGDVRAAFATGNLCQPSTVMLTRARMLAAGSFDETMRSGEDHAYHLACASAGPCALLDASSVRYTKGAGDQLTVPAWKLTIARNYLRTIAPVLGEVGLPDAVVRDTLADAHAWIGHELLERGERREAREHLVASLRRRAWQPRAWLDLATTAAPAAAMARARAALRRVKALRPR